MTLAIREDGTTRRVIHNETVIMVKGDERLSFSIKDRKSKVDFVINFTFSDTGKERNTEGELSEDGKIINITLHQWEGSPGVEIITPYEYTTVKTKQKIWIKFKTSSNKKYSMRTFHLTVWIKE